ncbi:MAG TPA: hypothetical protein VM889_07495 [Candidatus Thermoplasmatota archaeon]|nr:hypothetical protein [Candidatus Thermoplasmatota archaeon]
MDPLALLVASLALVLLTPLLAGGALALVVRWLVRRETPTS